MFFIFQTPTLQTPLVCTWSQSLGMIVSSKQIDIISYLMHIDQSIFRYAFRVSIIHTNCCLFFQKFQIWWYCINLMVWWYKFGHLTLIFCEDNTLKYCDCQCNVMHKYQAFISAENMRNSGSGPSGVNKKSNTFGSIFRRQHSQD